MKSTLISKNVTIRGRRTSLRLEEEIWEALRDVCRREAVNMHELCTLIEDCRGKSSRTSTVRAFIVTYLRKALNGQEIKEVVIPGIFPRP